MSFDWIICRVSMSSSRGNVSFPEWVYMVLSQKLASDLWTNHEEWWTALVPSLRETGWAEFSADSIILAQPVGLVALEDSCWKGNPLEISLCLGQKLLHWPCARKWSVSSGCLLSLSQPFPACELFSSPRKVMKGEVARQLQSTTCHGGCGAQSPAGQWKTQDFLFQLIKTLDLLQLFQKFESNIVPTANSSWIILGFDVDNITQEVLDPLSSSLDRVIFSSGAKSPASGSLLCCGTWSKSVWRAAPGCQDTSQPYSAPHWMNVLEQSK